MCGARLFGDETCETLFHRCLALEYEHPSAFGAVHHLTVLCYMLQHNLYSHAVWLEGRALIGRFLRNEITPTELVKQTHQTRASMKRDGHVTKGAKLPTFQTISWSYTIADVRLTTPKLYCADVEQWAQAVFADTADVVG